MKIVDHEQRREEVAKAAAGIIAAEGIEALTTRRLAKELGCSLGVLSHYFSNKDEILLAALNWADRRITERLTKAIEAPFRLDQFKPIVLQVLPLDEASDVEWRVRINLITYALSHPEILARQREQLLSGYKMAADLVASLQARGEIRGDIPAVETANSIVDLMSGMAINLLMIPLADRRQRIEFIDGYWDELRGAGKLALAAVP